MRLAIVIGISEYDNSNNLAACKNDAILINDILKKLNKFDDICTIIGRCEAKSAKNKISSFITKFKNEEVIEVVFYFSGHGARYENDEDYFYVFSDFNSERKETTGLRNSELDGFLRNLNPELTVKIVDSCYSGTNYIKSGPSLKPFFEKSAKQNNLNKLYFLHSSNSKQVSYAGDVYSYFTYSLCKSLTIDTGSIRYRDIMSYVADDLTSQSIQPTFVTQADYIEEFGVIDDDLITYINEKLEVIDTTVLNSDINDNKSKDNDLVELVNTKSTNEYCNYQEAESNINAIKKLIEEEKWRSEIEKLFQIEIELIEDSSQIPNSKSIGNWLEENSKHSFFAEPSYMTEKYIVEEYIKVPKKPKSASSNYLSAINSLSILFGDEDDYRLEKVEKEKQVVYGFNYTAKSPFRGISIKFNPEMQALDTYHTTIVILFSRKSLAIFTSNEILPYIDWDKIAKPKCYDWSVEVIPLKNLEEINAHTHEIISTVISFIKNDIFTRLT
ncbi:caspase family protein [Psychrobacter sanguinis]|uniref:caspase family protein n=1 Tax=Psychrobacter sanguinis TaxID=861445 RepID=UPI0028A2B029|nr:caspase family protein [Psychrobacter sanguinis]